MLKEMMVVDYSDQNIQSMLKLVEEQSLVKSKKSSLNNSIKQQHP